MENQVKKTTLVVIGYSDGSYEYAAGEHAGEVSDFINSAQAMLCIHGGEYRGRKMISVPASNDLEPIRPIAERTFPDWVAEISKAQHREIKMAKKVADRLLGIPEPQVVTQPRMGGKKHGHKGRHKKY